MPARYSDEDALRMLCMFVLGDPDDEVRTTLRSEISDAHVQEVIRQATQPGWGWLRNSNFQIAICIGLADAFRHVRESNGDGIGEFTRRLRRVFGSITAEMIKTIAIARMAVNMGSGINQFISATEFLQFMAWMEAGDPLFVQKLSSTKRIPVIHGTQTWMVSCPTCGTEKRCDSNTKRFRCKCGFESAFPLSAKKI